MSNERLNKLLVYILYIIMAVLLITWSMKIDVNAAVYKCQGLKCFTTNKFDESVLGKAKPKYKKLKVKKVKYQPTWKFEKLAKCESGSRWSYDGLYDGGLQFAPATWTKAKKLYKPAKKYKYAHKAPKHIQIEVAKRWQKKTSWQQWYNCSKKLGFI